MTHSTADQIEEIKKSEQSAMESIEKARENNDKAEIKRASELKSELEKFKEELRAKHDQATEKARKEAEGIKVSKFKESEGEKNNIISAAKQKTNAVNFIVDRFISSLK